MRCLSLLAVVMLASAAWAENPTQWVDGPTVPVGIPAFQFLESHVGYATEPGGGLPRVFTPFYGHLVVSSTQQALDLTVLTEVVLPAGVSLAVSEALPIRCFVSTNGEPANELMPPECPRAAIAADHGLAFAPAQQSGWTIKPGQTLEIWFPIETQDEERAATLGAAVETDLLGAQWTLATVNLDVGALPVPVFALASTVVLGSSGSAAFYGSVTTFGRPGTLFLDRGPTESYGTSSAIQSFTATDMGAVHFSSKLSGFEAATTYHWRLRFVDANDESFTTTDQSFVMPAQVPTADAGTVSGGSVVDAGSENGPGSSSTPTGVPTAASEAKKPVAQGCSASPLQLDWVALFVVVLSGVLARRYSASVRRAAPVLGLVLALAAGSARAGDDITWSDGGVETVMNTDIDTGESSVMATTTIQYQKDDAARLPHMFRTFYARVLVSVPSTAYHFGTVQVYPGVLYDTATWYPTQPSKDLPIQCFLYRTKDGPQAPSDLCTQIVETPGPVNRQLSFPPANMAETDGYWTVSPGQTLEIWFSVASDAPSASLTAYVVFQSSNALEKKITATSATTKLNVYEVPWPTFDMSQPVSKVTSSSAHLTGSVDSFSEYGEVYLDFGATTAYDPGILLGGTDVETATQFSSDVTRLAPATTYHWRLRFVRDDGLVVTSPDQTFTTLARPPDIAVDGGVSTTPADAGTGPIIITTSTPDPTTDEDPKKPKQGCSAAPLGLDGLAFLAVAGLLAVAARRKHPTRG